ncbi:MAG: hypothetical protein OHK0053_18220 [Microscillaceae bacterium]
MNAFRRLTFTQKLNLSFAVILSISLLVGTIAFYQLSSLHKINQDLRNQWMPAIDTLRNITDNFDKYLTTEYAYIGAKDFRQKENLATKMEALRRNIRDNEQAFAQLHLAGEQEKVFRVYRDTIQAFMTNSELILRLADNDKVDSSLAIRRSPERINLLEGTRRHLTKITKSCIKGGINSTIESDLSYRRALFFIGIFLGTAFLVGVLVSRIVSRDIRAQVGGEPAQIAEIAQQVSLGNLEVSFITRNRQEEGIYASVKEVVNTLKDVVQIARRISDGDTSQSIRVKSEHDALANSINQMIDHFKKQNRITEGLNDLTQSISGNLTPVEIANRAVSFVSRFLEAAQGALYVFHRERESLDLLGTYAFAERDSLSNHFKLGEGLVGQVALERKEILLRSVSRKDALITTGLVQEVPRVLYATPLLHEEELYGVLELASFHDFDEAGRIFLGDANKIIAIYLHTADQNEKVKHLLQVAEEAKALSEAKTQEVMMINAQLEQNQEELRASAEELNQRSRELEVANAEMDELNQNLEKRIEARTHEINQQKEEIMAQRDNLEKANLELEAEKEKADKLLLNILPEEIAEELKTKGKTDTRYYKLASVMFTDFEGFTRSASNMGPTELVQSLNEVFAKFDEIIEKHNLEKIKTLGDGYMCAGGLPVPNLTNPIEMVLAGLEIQRFMHKKKMEKKLQGEDYWGLRLGINSGEVIAGVIGTRKFAYDVWGDTVNAASRMESNGESGKVNISQRTYELVKDFFVCDYRGKLVVKGKGEMDMYFVRAIKPELSVGELGIEPNELFYQNLKAYEFNILSSMEV